MCCIFCNSFQLLIRDVCKPSVGELVVNHITIVHQPFFLWHYARAIGISAERRITSRSRQVQRAFGNPFLPKTQPMGFRNSFGVFADDTTTRCVHAPEIKRRRGVEFLDNVHRKI